MRQILYVSESTGPLDEVELARVVQQSRNNNALDGVTGLLWSDGTRFVQVLEGDAEALDDAMRRIAADPRHRSITVLHDRVVAEREFGSWSMELRSAVSAPDGHDARIRHLLDGASDAIRNVFASVIAPVTA